MRRPSPGHVDVYITILDSHAAAPQSGRDGVASPEFRVRVNIMELFHSRQRHDGGIVPVHRHVPVLTWQRQRRLYGKVRIEEDNLGICTIR
ncbi:MAG: hypothetical protein ABW185_22990 [Sedimenticola sp.]